MKQTVTIDQMLDKIAEERRHELRREKNYASRGEEDLRVKHGKRAFAYRVILLSYGRKAKKA